MFPGVHTIDWSVQMQCAVTDMIRGGKVVTQVPGAYVRESPPPPGRVTALCSPIPPDFDSTFHPLRLRYRTDHLHLQLSPIKMLPGLSGYPYRSYALFLSRPK
jgi:hypothetical protein